MFERSSAVDEFGMDEWEADRRSRLVHTILFWTWYLPADIVRSRPQRRPAPRTREPSLRRPADRRTIA